MSTKEYPIVENAESFEAALARVKEAQKIFATYTQEQVDKIFLAAATAANKMRIPLAKMAVEERGQGIRNTENRRAYRRYRSRNPHNKSHIYSYL